MAGRAVVLGKLGPATGPVRTSLGGLLRAAFEQLEGGAARNELTDGPGSGREISARVPAGFHPMGREVGEKRENSKLSRGCPAAIRS